jgi:hypothetical protein
MDVNGAKALKKRLAMNGADEAPPAAEPAEVPADAPPVYHWTGKTPPEAAPPRGGGRNRASQCLAVSRLALNLR